MCRLQERLLIHDVFWYSVLVVVLVVCCGSLGELRNTVVITAVSAFVPNSIHSTGCHNHYHHQNQRHVSHRHRNTFLCSSDERQHRSSVAGRNSIDDDDAHTSTSQNELQCATTSITGSNRRHLLRNSMSNVISSVVILSSVDRSNALVKGNAPPPTTSATSSLNKSGEKIKKCTNVEECQEMAERREQQLREQQDKEAQESSTTIVTTKRGTRYRDVSNNSDETTTNGKTIVRTTTVQEGDMVTMYYKVLKLGKRSYDGLSGEGTVVFSCGYGLEDYETSPRTKSFTTTIGNYNNIVALNDGMIGMTPNTIRRIQILPDRGWRKPDTYCDGGPGGSGTGGNLKTDYVVVPTATMVATETCFDTTKLPFPTQSYAEQRRMAQRFDQSLILEVEVIDIVKPS